MITAVFSPVPCYFSLYLRCLLFFAQCLTYDEQVLVNFLILDYRVDSIDWINLLGILSLLFGTLSLWIFMLDPEHCGCILWIYHLELLELLVEFTSHFWIICLKKQICLHLDPQPSSLCIHYRSHKLLLTLTPTTLLWLIFIGQSLNCLHPDITSLSGNNRWKQHRCLG